MPHRQPQHVARASGQGAPRRKWGAVAFAMAFPTALTLTYFVLLADQPRWLVQGVYGIGKVVQFAFPAVWVAWAGGGLRRPSWPGQRGAWAGLGFGLLLLAAAVALYALALRPAGVLASAPAEAVRAKVTSFGADTWPRYLALGAFYSLLHAAAEEYYWRWFVFGELRRSCRLGWAIAASGLAFAAHHLVLLGVYFGWASPWTFALGAAVAAGGAFWAWLYQRSGSLLGPWLGHVMADVAIFTIGWQLVSSGR